MVRFARKGMPETRAAEHGRARIGARWLLATALLTAALPESFAQARGDGDAVAVVNGHPIARVDLFDALIDAYGVQVLQQLIVLDLARQETARRKIRVTSGDVEREFQESVERIAQEAGLDPRRSSEAQRMKALETLLEQKSISMAEFRLSMARNAHLRKLVEQDLRLDEPTLREEFSRTYGERVLVRHIQVSFDDGRTLNEVVTHLSRGEDFAELARRLSQNADTAPRGGLMEPFGFDDESIPAALRDGAFALRPGEISTPIRAGQMMHVLKLERRIPPDNVRFEDVRDEVERNMRERALPRRMADLAGELFRQARIQVIDPRLRDRYEEFLRSNTPATGG